MRGLLGATALAVLCAALPAAENMIGRQSQNEGITAVPAPGPVVVDGLLDDWDRSGTIWSFADISVRDRFSVRTAAMWDAEYLYLSFLWKDPMPLHSVVNPEHDPDKGWVSDAIQLRIVAGGQTSWFTTWPFTPEPGVIRPVLHLSYWKDESNNRKGQDILLLVGQPGDANLRVLTGAPDDPRAEGVQMAYRLLPENEGKGFIQEMRLPWRVVYNRPRAAQAGDVFQMGCEFLWGSAEGQKWPAHRYADNMLPGATSREFFWTAKKAWGEVRLADRGGLEPRRYVEGDNAPKGVIPVRATLPVPDGGIDRIAGFTLVVEDAEGKRVRNLAGDFDPREYAVQNAPEGTVEVRWDGTDDQGQLVAPGTYTVRGLVHGAMGADYERCFYNPGTPPWEMPDGKGAWGADHAIARHVTRAADGVVIGWNFAEGGHGLIGVGPDGRKRWGEKRGVGALAGNDTHVFFMPNTWHTKEPQLMRVNAKTGQYAPFVLHGKKRGLELSLAEVLKDSPLADAEKTGALVAMAATNDTLALLFAHGAVALLDPESAAVRRVFDAPAADETPPPAAADNADNVVHSLAFLADGHVLLVNHAGRLQRLDTREGTRADLPALPGLHTPGAVAAGPQGAMWIVDRGPDQQVKAFDADGKPLAAIGAQGGRPIRGPWRPDALMNVSAVAVDGQGQLWATEYWNFPRRVSVWATDGGALARDYIGNTGYAGTGCFLHENDPARGYVGPIEIALPPDSRDWSVNGIVWVPDPEAGESFRVAPDNHTQPTVFYSDASGQRREYMFVPGYRDYHGFILLMKDGEQWRPVSAVGTVGMVSGKFANHGQTVAAPSGEFEGCNLFDGLIWNDRNNDGKVQRDECEIKATTRPGTDTKRGHQPWPTSNGWGARMNPADLVFYASDNTGAYEYRPLEFTPEGAPAYGSQGLRAIGNKTRGEWVPVPGEDTLLSMAPGKIAGVDRRTGSEIWTYPNPYPHVHGSHRATMPKPGLLIGPLKIMGVVDGGKPNAFFALRGNLGQDFYLTTDGLFIGAMFLDGRLPGMGLPATEDQLAAMPLEMYSNGGEPFNGWLGRQDDGVIRMTNGLPRQAAMVTRLRGLDTIQRFNAPSVVLTAESLAKAGEDNLLRKSAAAAAAEYKIRQKPRNTWKDVPVLTVARQGQPAFAHVQLAYDAKNLYARFDVRDPSPWKNNGKDMTQLFKTGDVVDIQLSPAANDTKAPQAGDQRILIAPFNRKPTAVLMRQLDPDAPEAERARYHSPVMDVSFDKVVALADAKIDVAVEPGLGYTVEAVLPWASLGMAPEAGRAIRGDVGFILSDDAGTINTARIYWSNSATNLVNDLPGEAKLEPHHWGAMRFE